MRILVILPPQLPVPPIKGGSVETNTWHTFKRMARTDRVTIISRAHASLPAAGSMLGGNLRILRIARSNPGSYLQAALRKVNRRRYDVIQIENRPLYVPKVRKAFPRTPVVLSLHSLHFLSLLSKRKAYSVLRQVHRVTTVVPFLTTTMKRRYPKYAHKFRTATLGVDTKKFRPRSQGYKQKVRRKWKLTGSYNLLFVGRIVPKKGLHTLVKAAGRLKRVRGRKPVIVAVGASWPGVKRRTRYMRSVARLSKRSGVKIRFTGYIPPARMPSMYHLGDVFVCPTQYREGFATVNPEAMASGIPVVASRRGGILQVVRHGQSGWLVRQYRSPKAFTTSIARLRRSPRLAKRLSRGGRRRVLRRYSWSNTVRALKKHYRAIRK